MRFLLAGVAAGLLSVTVLARELALQVPILAPRVVAWAEQEEANAMAQGRPLTPRMRALARSVGVSDPSRVSVMIVDHVPLPDEPMLRAAAESLGFTKMNITGLTLGHAIFVRRGRDRDPVLLSHELRHVAQYESQGGIAPFLARHVMDLVEHGYEDSPFEVDARAHERKTFPPIRS
jgi:hypothetical protein